MLTNWLSAYKLDKLNIIGGKQKQKSESEIELARLKRIRSESNIYCKQSKKFKTMTDSRHSFTAADNLLKQKFEAYSPNSIWLSDIT